MQSCQRAVVILRRTGGFVIKPNPTCTARYFSSDNIEKNETLEDSSKSEDEAGTKVELSGFAKSFAKFAEPKQEKLEQNEMTFARLLRNSNFVDLGDPEGKVVPGKIFHVVGDDLYIDFGSKFHCVCARPIKNSSAYVRGALVRVRIKDLELSTKFLGASKDLTILEADCTLHSLVNTPMKNATIL